MTEPVWRLRPVTQQDARDFAKWRYPEPYSLYNAEPGDAEHYLEPANGYFAVDEYGSLVAHVCYGADARVTGGRYDHDAIDFGAGMRPDRIGGGRGKHLLRVALDEAHERWPGKRLRTTIAAFNERAQHLVRKAGFGEVEIFRSPTGREYIVYVEADR